MIVRRFFVSVFAATLLVGACGGDPPPPPPPPPGPDMDSLRAYNDSVAAAEAEARRLTAEAAAAAARQRPSPPRARRSGRWSSSITTSRRSATTPLRTSGPRSAFCARARRCSCVSRDTPTRARRRDG